MEVISLHSSSPASFAEPLARHSLVVCSIVLFALGGSTMACKRDSSSLDDGSPPATVILILIDTLRAGHVGAYGDRIPSLILAIDRLASKE